MIIAALVCIALGHHFAKHGDRLFGLLGWGSGLYLLWSSFPNALHALIARPEMSSLISVGCVFIAALVGCRIIFSRPGTQRRVYRQCNR